MLKSFCFYHYSLSGVPSSLTNIRNVQPEIHAENNNADTVTAPLCDSPECIHAASELLYNLDPNYGEVDPCTDFDRFACGGWRERHDMRSDQGSIFAGTLMAENAHVRLRHILEAESTQDTSSSDSENFRKLRAAYDACMDVPSLKEKGTKQLEHVLGQLSDIYSAGSSSAKGPMKDLTGPLLYLIKIGVEALVSTYIAVREISLTDLFTVTARVHSVAFC